MSTSPADAVRAYFAVVADVDSTESDLRAVLHPDAVFVEHPSPMAPHGRTHGLDVELDIEVRSLLVEGDRVAVQSTWTAVMAHDVGALGAGTRLTAHMAGFLTVKDGLVVRHETYDCYEPFGASARR